MKRSKKRYTTTTDAITALLQSPATFSAANARPFRPYQAEAANAIAQSVINNQGKTFTVMCARQMGKNELSAQLEAYLLTLYAHRGGSMVKSAPSFKPQIVNSILRLKDTLQNGPLTRGRWRGSFGYMVLLKNASISFLSADKNANIVGATASLLLEVDEAQDVDPDIYDRSLRPMASSTNATTVLYGTAWATNSLLERVKLQNLELEHETGEKRHFEYDWTVLAAINAHYKNFVQHEINRLGMDHPTIQTQYLLHTLSDAGSLLSEAQKALLQGTHPRQHAPTPNTTYVAGIDVAGEDEAHSDSQARLLAPKRDSTVITIAEVSHTQDGPSTKVVEHIWWTGRDQVWQFEQINAIWQRWNLTYAVVDASGIGHGLSQFLAAHHPNRVEQLIFTRPTKSLLAYDLLAAINTKSLTVYQPDGSPHSQQLWWEIDHTTYNLHANDIMSWSVPDSLGHDDFIISLALACRAAAAAPPPAYGGLARAQPDNLYTRW